MSSDEENVIEESQNEDQQLAFVIMLEDFKIILDKRMTPSIKSAKDAALKELTELFNKNMNENLTSKQVLKKVNNMKSKIKKITDLKRTGNKKIKLNEWQQKFFDLWNANENPIIQKVPGGVTAGTSKDEPVGRKRRLISEEQTIDELTDLRLLFDENELNTTSSEKLQRILLIKQIKATSAQEKAAVAQEKAAMSQEKAANAVEKAANAVEKAAQATEQFIENYFLSQHSGA